MKNIVYGVLLVLCISSANVRSEDYFFGSTITKLIPGSGSNGFEVDTENPHFRNHQCPYFNMGKFVSSDPGELSRYYSSALAAMVAQLPVVVYYNQNDPCLIEMIVLQAPM